MAAEAIVGPIVERLVSLAADAIDGQLRAAWGLKDNLEELKRLLRRIQSILADAEEKQVVDEAVKPWLNALKKVAYKAEDVLDELNYETLRHKAAEVAPDNKTPCSGKVRDFFSSHNPLLIRQKMGRKVSNLLEEITKIAEESKKFNFKEVVIQPETPAPAIETISFVEESEVVGRRGEQDEIVKLLINKVKSRNAENVAVLPIVGMGGLGKTTLAQLIYNDPRVVDYFELRAWVCVSDPWDAKKIIQEILNLVGKKCESTSMEGLHLAFKDALTQKRFLIVLDDVWEEDPSKWNTLKSLLRCGGEGSAVIVTTRNQRVSDITATLQSCHPPYLSEDESWELFSKRAFTSGAERPKELVDIGRTIAKKCGGLPLALRMLGSLLYMESDKSQWSKIKESDMWNIETGILPALRLSYKHLPSHSKQCFTFCAIYPKDREMKKEKLINLWMAHGFIPSDGGRLEVKGNEIFNQLLQRSFFQDLKEELSSHASSYYLRTTCRMHDLVHDLALSIAGKDFVAVQEESFKDSEIKDAYHLSFLSSDDLNINHMLKASPYLRTILMTPDLRTVAKSNNMKGSTSLRVLALIAETLRLPSSMKCLQHLRYLKLRSSTLSELPESIRTLFNLQTLDLSWCEKLRRLPKRMSCMINLRHLYLDECDELRIMAPGMGRMTNLQTLTMYVVGEESGRGIGELKGLQLSSRLKLRNLGSVKDVKEAREVDLHSKEVSLLSLDWTGGGGGGGGGISNAEQVLEELKPPGSVKFLEILGYDGLYFPKWMGDMLLLQHLVKLRLHHCRGLQRLPPLWQLSSLERLSLKHMKNLKYIISDNPAADDTTVQAFRSLKKLKMDDLESLEKWRENENAKLQEAMANFFPALDYLKISNCPEMASSLPLAPCLKYLELEDCKKIPLRSINALTSLVSLDITNNEKELLDDSTHYVHDSADSFLAHGTLALGHLRCLERLHIRSLCKEQALVWGHEDEKEEGSVHSSSLNELWLTECDRIASSPRCYGLWTSMTSLECLNIFECHDLVILPCQVFRGLRSLRRLVFSKCDNITGELSAGTDACLLPQLEYMRLRDCSTLETVPPIGGPSLKELDIGECRNLVSLAAAEQDLGHLTSLETLYISKCPRLTSLPLDGLPALRRLELAYCTNLASLLPEGIVLPALEHLSVEGCPQLEKKCVEGGEYSNVPDLHLVPFHMTGVIETQRDIRTRIHTHFFAWQMLRLAMIDED